uniref:NADH-ubiquinone oxidoreductase chain 6 n=1 Tax=Curculionoidea sp. 26 KM-2017 TaxID=2219410 RepID=A0A346RJ21_9CUCU|nr:NADH dehydrogenase subunit 6 [Curculionoidea sp. 26 KM-2017]
MMSLLITFSTMFIFMSHPLSISMILFLQTLLISIITGKLNNNFWFSYILFLILIGGLMILFIYMTSIASNEKFKLSLKLLLFSVIIASIAAFQFHAFPFFNMNNFLYLSPLPAINKTINSNMMISFNLIIIYLLVCLIAVTNLTKSTSGPLRQMF